MIRFALVSLCAVALAACQNINLSRGDQSFDGQYFRTNAKSVDGDRRQFEVTIRKATASLEGAQEAGRVESAKYCIENYGTSAVDWVIGPDDAPESYVLDGDTLRLRGACTG